MHIKNIHFFLSNLYVECGHAYMLTVSEALSTLYKNKQEQ